MHDRHWMSDLAAGITPTGVCGTPGWVTMHLDGVDGTVPVTCKPCIGIALSGEAYPPAAARALRVAA